MGKKEQEQFLPIQISAEVPVAGVPAFLAEDITLEEWEKMTLKQKRDKVLKTTGRKGTKKKYASEAERKEAAKKRAKDKKKAETEYLKTLGLEPRKKAKKTKEEKAEARRERGKRRREGFREMAKLHPDLAKKHGIDVSRFKL